MDLRDVLGVAGDMGGSATRVLVTGRGLPAPQRGRSGAGNPFVAGPEAAGRHLLEALQKALGGLAPRPRARVCVGLAGRSHPQGERLVRQALEQELRVVQCLVVEDAELMLEAGLAGRDGVLVLAGTGSGAWARRGDARFRVGGQGHLIGDPGSGQMLVLKALRAAALAASNRGPATSLSKLFQEFLPLAGDENPGALGASSRANLAAHFPRLLEAAQRGDQVAREILVEGGRELGRMALAVVRLAGPWPDAISLITGGGVLAHASEVVSALLEDLRGSVPPLVWGGQVEDPLAGGLSLLARDDAPGRSSRIINK